MARASQRMSRLLAVAGVFASVSLSSGQGQEQRPQDVTAPDVPGVIEREVDDGGPEKDDPTARLDWQRQAWGPVTSTFRVTAMRQGRNDSNQKNACGPTWVSIGPGASEFDEIGPFTGNAVDRGSASVI